MAVSRNESMNVGRARPFDTCPCDGVCVEDVYEVSVWFNWILPRATAIQEDPVVRNVGEGMLGAY